MSRAGHDPIAVMIVEDQRTIRKGLALLIDHTDGFRCSGSFETMERALPAVAAAPPDVLLVDLGLPGMSGVDGIRRICARHSGLAVLVLAVYDDDERIFGAILAGASGYVLKTAPPTQLRRSLRSVVEGGAPMTPEVARRVLTSWREAGAASPLTTEEKRTLQKLAEGHVYTTAAADLHLPVREIGAQMRRVYEKLHHRRA